jgi:hypothetical protein
MGGFDACQSQRPRCVACLQESGDQLTPPPVASELNRLVAPVILGLVVLSSIRRKQAVGGWLLFFFGEVYVAVAVGAMAGIPVVAAVSPGPPSPSSPNLRLPALVVSLRMAVASTFLLKTREPLWGETTSHCDWPGTDARWDYLDRRHTLFSRHAGREYGEMVCLVGLAWVFLGAGAGAHGFLFENLG